MRPRAGGSGAIVLAGGGSRRMGQDKASLRLGGRTLLERVAEELLETVDELVVVGHPGQTLPPLPAGARRVDDPPDHGGGGPLVGLLAGLLALRDLGAERAYLASVDTVFLSRVHVDWMLAQLEGEVVAALPEQDGRVHPLAGAVSVGPALAVAQSLVDGGRRSARALFETMSARHVTQLPDPRVLRPCNTPEEWAALQVEWGE